MRIPSWSEAEPKIISAALAAVLFFIVSNPLTYKLVDRVITPVLGRVFKTVEAGCPTHVGLLIHTGVFFSLTLALQYV